MHIKTKYKIRQIRKYLYDNYGKWVRMSGGSVHGAYVCRKIRKGQTINRYAIVFEVSKKEDKPLDQMIPAYIEMPSESGEVLKVPTDVIESASFKLLSYALGSKTQYVNDASWGTVGLILYKDNTNYLCSNMHVLAPDLIVSGVFDFDYSNNPPTQPDVAVWVEGYPKKVVAAREKGAFSKLDAALAKITDPGVLENRLPGSDNPDDFIVLDDSNKDTYSVTMAGARSGLQSSVVRQIEAIRSTVFRGVSANFGGLVKIDNIALEGDSGSPVFGTNDKLVVGIVVGGDGLFTYVIPVSAILDYFGVNLKTTL